MGAKWQRFDVVIPKAIKSTKDKLALGEHIVEYIRQRTEKGKDNEYKNFPKYSDKYEASLDFKIGGKSKGQRPDLKLTGDMLADLQVLSIRGDKLLIGYKNGSKSNAKADGHQTGWQGQRPNAERPFLGFEGSEKAKLKSIIKEHVAAVKDDDTSLRAYAYLSAKDIKTKVKPRIKPDETLDED